jgi:hypothetical protein
MALKDYFGVDGNSLRLEYLQHDLIELPAAIVLEIFPESLYWYERGFLFRRDIGHHLDAGFTFECEEIL